MGKISSFNIIFDKNIPIYYSGEKLSGKVNIEVAERLKINEINLEIVGASRVHWYYLILNTLF